MAPGQNSPGLVLYNFDHVSTDSSQSSTGGIHGSPCSQISQQNKGHGLVVQPMQK